MTKSDTPLDPAKLLAQAAEALQRDSQATAVGAAPPSIEELQPSFDNYKILSLIGRGGMGAVYRAQHVQLDREVALKILPKELATDPTFEERFVREARALALLEHPHILRVYDFGQAGGWFFLATEFVDGANLRQLMELERVSPPEAVRLIPQICDALDFAHGRGVVHRDIKPENILVDAAGQVKIADFGIAKLTGDATESLHLTHTRQVLGTPHYMAPEQIEQPTSVDHRADIFSLGVVFYELLTGQLPIGHFEEPSKRGGASPKLDAVVMKSLRTEPMRRFQSAGELKAAVKGGGGSSLDVRRERWRESREARRDQRSGQRAFAIAAGLIGGAAFLLFPISFIGPVLVIVGAVLAIRNRSHYRDNPQRPSAMNVVTAWMPLTAFAALMFSVLITSLASKANGWSNYESEAARSWVALASLAGFVCVQIWLVRTMRRR